MPILLSLRPLNLLLIFVLQLTIFIVGGGLDFFDFIVFLTLPVLLVTTGGYLVNNYFDQEKDALNQKKSRPTLSRGIFLFLYLGLNIVAVAVAFVYSYWLAIIVLAVVFLLFLYAKWLSNWPLVGNFIVAFLSAFSVGIIYFFPIDIKWEMTHLYFLIILVFNVSLVRELIKDCEDLEGDKIVGAQTIPIVLGLKFTHFICSFILVVNSVFIMAWAFYFLNSSNVYFWFILILALFGFVGVFSLFSIRSISKYSILSSLLKVYMFLGVFLIPVLK